MFRLTHTGGANRFFRTGWPDSGCRSVVRQLGRLCTAGVEVSGLGMLTMVVWELFPFHTVAGPFREVSEALFRLLQGRLTR